MRVVRGPVYTPFDERMVPDTYHWNNGYYPDVRRDEADTRGPVTVGMLQALGHSKWRLALIFYSQARKYDECHPKLEVFLFDGARGSWEPNIRVQRKYRPIRWDKVQFYGSEVMDAVEQNLRALSTGPQFAVLCSFEFPVHPSYLPAKIRSTFGPHRHPSRSTESFVLRAFYDLPAHFQQSGDPELANAAALAELMV